MEITIIILYLVVIFGVGIYCNKYNKNVDDYLLAGRHLGVGLATGTLVATYFGGGYVIGVGSEAYNVGVSSYWSPVAGALGILAVCLVLKKMEGMRVYTVTEIVEHRYNSSFLRLATTILSIGLGRNFGQPGEFRRQCISFFRDWRHYYECHHCNGFLCWIYRFWWLVGSYNHRLYPNHRCISWANICNASYHL